tara:strand:- start:645 stop:1649 length:1005 start_codon:yes stop_codon:yes gene_type:complete
MKKILLIGGEGYIGNVVAHKLLADGYSIISYDNLLYNNHICVTNKLHLKNYKFIFGDMLDKNTIKPLIQDSYAVVLLAGLVGDPITKKYPNESSIINDKAVANVIELCSSVDTNRFIFISTCSNYGIIDDNEFADENYKLNPLSLYAKSKVNAENYILSFKGNSKMSPTILRFATAFGLSPRMRFDLTISEFTRDLAMNKELLVYDANTWRPYCHVQDFSRLIKMVIQAPKEDISFQVFNAGGNINNATKQKIVNYILDKIPNGKVKYQDDGKDTRNYRVSFEKIRSILGFEPSFNIEDGINELLYAIDNNIFDKVEDNKIFHGNYEIDYLLKA